MSLFKPSRSYVVPYHSLRTFTCQKKTNDLGTGHLLPEGGLGRKWGRLQKIHDI